MAGHCLFDIIHFSTYSRANKWEILSPLPQKTADLVCTFFNDRLVVVGGMGAESMEVLPKVGK